VLERTHHQHKALLLASIDGHGQPSAAAAATAATIENKYQEIFLFALEICRKVMERI
jgi:hypothetical protein